MGTRIRYSTAAMRSCMNELSQLSSMLSQVSASLSSINVGAEAGGNRAHSISCSLSSVGSSVSASTIGGCSSALARAARSLGERASQLRTATANAASTFEQTENGVVGLFGGPSIVVDGGASIGMSWKNVASAVGGVAGTAAGIGVDLGVMPASKGSNIVDDTSTTWDNRFNATAFHYTDENLDVKIGEIDSYSSGSVGMFTTNENGDVVLNPHGNWQSGFSATAFAAKGDYSVGNDMLGAQAHFNMEVGSAKVNTEGCFSLLDKNGNINPNAKVNVNMEAVALRAEAEGSISVLNGEVSAGADVGVGMGGHLDVGIKDGVFTLDVGAYLGIGGSAHISVDVGGMVDGAVDTFKGFCKGVGNFLHLW